MTRPPFVMRKAHSAFDRAQKLEDTTLGWRFVNPAMRIAYGVDTMPETGENVAAEWGVSRVEHDAFCAARIKPPLRRPAGVSPPRSSRSRSRRKG